MWKTLQERRPPAQMPGPGFVHLHTHSEYSLLDGAARVEAPRSNPSAPTIFSEAARDGMSAIAVTDHGAMFGALRFYEAARKTGLKPIMGVEAYVAPGSRFDRTPGESEEKYYHLTLLAENETGYRNLLRLVSLAHLEGFYHRPRMDKQLLAEHADGLICLSGCLSSELGVLLVNGQHDRALAASGDTRDIFGAGNYFVEIQDHGLADQRRIIGEQIRIAGELGVPVVATNDLHYTRREDAKPHDVLLCIQQQKLQSDPKRLRFDSEEFYLKTSEEMRRCHGSRRRTARRSKRTYGSSWSVAWSNATGRRLPWRSSSASTRSSRSSRRWVSPATSSSCGI
ncbi:MAG: PHP domain-containing protein [Actinobacteria bacterium]|nr:MAG: PHP domain-containing protein [Actinomycetota bacterium]